MQLIVLLTFFPKLFCESLVNLEVTFAYSWPLPRKNLVKVRSHDGRWTNLQ
ncbi:hypothetical protein Hanom_Chr01g00078441 [Helianthus anomalus]